jgi:hypothetical protein
VAEQTGAENTAARTERRRRRREKRAALRQALAATREGDRWLVWWLLIAFVGAFGVVFAGLYLLGVLWPLALVVGLLPGVLVTLIVFGRRAQRQAFTRAEGQPGAAGWVLKNLRGYWWVTLAVAGETELATVHQVIGRPGVILVAEGAGPEAGTLLDDEMERVYRVVGDIPIYDMLVGIGDGEVPLRKLPAHLARLPPNITVAEVKALREQLEVFRGATAAEIVEQPGPEEIN